MKQQQFVGLTKCNMLDLDQHSNSVSGLDSTGMGLQADKQSWYVTSHRAPQLLGILFST